MVFTGIVSGIPVQTYRLDQNWIYHGSIVFKVELDDGREHRLFVSGKIGKYLGRIGQGSLIQYSISDQDVFHVSKGKMVKVVNPFVRNSLFVKNSVY